MKKIITTTALALMLTAAAYSASHTAMFSAYKAEQTDLIATEFIGMRIYATETNIAVDAMVAKGDEAEWDDIGEINEVILSRDGSVLAVILGVGGFIGIGEKDVAVSMDNIRFVKEEGDSEDFFLVLKSNLQTLKDAPEYRSANEMAEIASERPMLVAPKVDREGYNSMEMEALTAEKLQGARVYGASDEDIGEIDALLLGANGQIEKAILDIGGFLGMGEHRISVTLMELNIVADKDGSDVRVYIDSSKETLMAQPAYTAG